MKKVKSALVISDNIITIHDMKRMLGELEIKHVFEAYDSQTGLKSTKKYQPSFIFLDTDLEAGSAEQILELLESKVSGRIILMKKKFTSEKGYHNSKHSVLEKPVTLNRLNDIVHPNLSFAALLDEARELVKEESVAAMFHI